MPTIFTLITQLLRNSSISSVIQVFNLCTTVVPFCFLVWYPKPMELSISADLLLVSFLFLSHMSMQRPYPQDTKHHGFYHPTFPDHMSSVRSSWWDCQEINKYILSIYNMPGSVTGGGEKAINKTENTFAFMKIIFYWGKLDKKQN